MSLVFRRKDLCEAKHDVVCLKFCSNLTLGRGGVNVTADFGGKSSLQIWGKLSLPILGGVIVTADLPSNHQVSVTPNRLYDLPPLKSAGMIYPKSAVTIYPNLQWRFTPPKLAGTIYPKSAVTIYPKSAVTIYPPRNQQGRFTQISSDDLPQICSDNLPPHPPKSAGWFTPNRQWWFTQICSDDLPPPKSAGRFTPNRQWQFPPNLQWWFTPPPQIVLGDLMC